MPHEVITLQFGKFANFTGAHYWNIQDQLLRIQQEDETVIAANQINSTILHRERPPANQSHRSTQYTTYSPRLVLFDTKDSTSSHLAAFPSPTQLPSTWDSQPVTYKRPPIQPSPYIQQRQRHQNYHSLGDNTNAYPSLLSPLTPHDDLLSAAQALDSRSGGVARFTDYMNSTVTTADALTSLDPRSMHFVDGLWNDSHQEQQAWCKPDSWAATSSNQLEVSMERIRYFAEECDSMAAFQFFVDDLSCWGDIARSVMQETRDEYGHGCSNFLYAMRSRSLASVANQENRRLLQLCQGLSTSYLTQECDVYIPVRVPSTPSSLPQYRQHDLYHESAVMASALHCSTLPYRISGSTPSCNEFAIGQTDPSSLAALLSGKYSTVPIAALGMSLPCPPLGTTAAEGGDREGQVLYGEDGDDRAPRRALYKMGTHTRITSAVTMTTESFLDTMLVSKQLQQLLHARGREEAGRATSVYDIGGASDDERFAESVVLCGVQRLDSSVRATASSSSSSKDAIAGMDLSLASRALDASLLQEPCRCVRHRAITSQAFPVPIPFPDIFSKSEIVREWNLRGGARQSVPVLTRLAGTKRVGEVLKCIGRDFLSASSNVRGQALLESWGVGKDGREEVSERLQEMESALKDGEALESDD